MQKNLNNISRYVKIRDGEYIKNLKKELKEN